MFSRPKAAASSTPCSAESRPVPPSTPSQSSRLAMPGSAPQIRLRLHVYYVPKCELPLNGDGDGAGEVERLASLTQAAVATPLPKKPPPPVLYPVRPAYPAPTSGAAALDIGHVKKICAAITGMMSMTARGVRTSAPRRRAVPAAASPPLPQAKRPRCFPGSSSPNTIAAISCRRRFRGRPR